MATKPRIATLTNSSVDILNAIRNNASTNYKDYVPYATPDADDIRKIGAVLMDFPSLQNEFLHALVNRIGKVIVVSKMYENPWAMFKQGMLEYGETIEEIFVDIARVHQYNPEIAENKLYQREIPDVKSAFHPLNYQKFYKVTVHKAQLRQAFLSINGVVDLVNRIIDSMYSGANYDEFQMMKYMLARHLLNGRIHPVVIPTLTKENAKDIVTTIKGVSNDFEFMNNKFNIAGVRNFTLKDNQYLIINSQFDATMDVEVLASAFNMDKAQFSGHRVLVDSFGALDNERLDMLMASDATYQKITDDELTALAMIPALIVDREWFMIWDNLLEVTERKNEEGLYWNYWLHLWKIFSISPFAQAVSFVPGTPLVNSVTVSPATATVSTGQSLSLSTIVDTEYFAPQSVTYSSSDETIAVVNGAGIVTALSAGSVTITVTSIFDETKTATAELTVA